MKVNVDPNMTTVMMPTDLTSYLHSTVDIREK